MTTATATTFDLKLTVRTDQQQLVLQCDCTYQLESQSFGLSHWMRFLYQYDKTLEEGYLNFGFLLAKLVKKQSIGTDTFFGIRDDMDMALLFEFAYEQSIPILIVNDSQSAPTFMQWSQTIPIQVSVFQKNRSIGCKLTEDHQRLLEDPTRFLMIKSPTKTHILCKDEVVIDVPETLCDFLYECSDQGQLWFKEHEKQRFIQSVYEPFQSWIQWDLAADLSSILPKHVDPKACLTITQNEGVLTPILSYFYDDIEVESHSTDDLIQDPKSAAEYIRQTDMEQVYQEDLMTLFQEHGLPFMLQSPTDKSQFLNHILPVLQRRDWKIINHAPDIQIVTEPTQINFSISSDSPDWFQFDSNCHVMGQAFSVTEIAKLMVDNQGFIQTKKGYVQIDQKSQDAIQQLQKLQAFKVGQTFSKRDILPLIDLADPDANGDHADALISKWKALKEDKSFTPSDSFKGALRPYQQQGVNWMMFLYHSGQHGILADDMGLGKTVQTLACSTLIDSPHPKLIIGPSTVLYNWKSEIQKFLPNHSVCMYHGSSRHSHQDKIQDYDFVITSFGVIKNDIEWFAAESFSAVFVDEAQNMKNSQSQLSKAMKTLSIPFKCLMTGTPIENHIDDLWNLFDFILPTFLGPQNNFQSSFEAQKDIIKSKIRPFILRRCKEEVLHDLPEKNTMTVTCPLHDQQIALYDAVLQATKKGLRNENGTINRLHVLSSILKLRQICTHPKLLKECENQDLPSGKFDTLFEKLSDVIQQQRKAVVFSQFKSALTLVEDHLKSNDTKVFRIDGQTPAKKRMDYINEFQELDGSAVFVISLKAGGVGINLTSAEYVFHLDPWWNPAVEAQATDRVHRMGQKNSVMVYRFITNGTIEEKVHLLQEQKKALFNDTLAFDQLESASESDFTSIISLLD